MQSTIGYVFFVGRARALSGLLAAARDAADGCARVVLVTGEAGMGKTTLVNVAAARSGLLVGWGTCAGAERTPAFGRGAWRCADCSPAWARSGLTS
jgi:AAA ATPase domain